MIVPVVHRLNDFQKTADLKAGFGIEIDIRFRDSQLVVQHDFDDNYSISLERYLSLIGDRFLVLNVKEEGLAKPVIDLARLHLSEFFVLDETFPFIKKTAEQSYQELAARVSDLEGVDSAMRLQKALLDKGKRIDWVWVDYFREMISPSEYDQLKSMGFKTCFVSPELHHLNDESCWQDLAANFKTNLLSKDIQPDKVCTKIPALWVD